MRTILLSLSNGRPVWHKWQLSPISSLPSFPPSGPLHHLCVMCVYKMLIERHSSPVAVIVAAAWGLGTGEGGWDDMDSRDILLMSVACLPKSTGFRAEVSLVTKGYNKV